MKTILVFSTSVSDLVAVGRLSPLLDKLINTDGKWNFDLEDRENILRVETQRPDVWAIHELLKAHGFSCRELV